MDFFNGQWTMDNGQLNWRFKDWEDYRLSIKVYWDNPMKIIGLTDIKTAVIIISMYFIEFFKNLFLLHRS
jgi:hypothetical protein